MSDVPSPYQALSEGAAEKAEVLSATMVVQALVKAERGFALYLPNNPLYEKFFEDFRRRLEEHLEQFGPLSLDLAHDSILFLGETIYAHEDRRENLAFRMFADGIRTFAFDRGVEPWEVRTLIEALRQAAADTGEDDVVTYLWSADLQHVRYELAEVPLGESGAASLGTGSLSAAPADREAQEGVIRSFAAELAAGPPAPPVLPLPQRIFHLEEHEIAVLQELVAAEQHRTPLEDVAGILEAVIAAEDEMIVLEEFLEIVARLCGDLLLTGRIDYAARLVGVLSRVGALPGLPPGRAAAVEAARNRVITEDVIEGLTRLFSAGDTVDREELRTLVTALGSGAIEPFCRILGEVNAKETRKVLVEALAETGRGSPDLFLPFLADPRWYLVRNTIYILRRIGSPEAARAVRRCAGHQDPRVRKEVLLYLEETGDSAGEPLLLGFLADEVSSLRFAATRGLARRGSSAAAEHLLALANGPGFAERERAEREAVWEAIAAIAPERAFPLLRGLLLKRRWFAQGRELEETACAVAGLRRIGTPAALDLLRQAAASKRGPARELVEKALREPAAGAGGRSRSARDPGRRGRG